MRGTIVGAMLNAAAVALAAIYLLALFPIAFLGLVAHADYGFRGCPGGMQCSDAASVMAMAVVYVFAAPIVWLLFKTLRTRAARHKGDA